MNTELLFEQHNDTYRVHVKVFVHFIYSVSWVRNDISIHLKYIYAPQSKVASFPETVVDLTYKPGQHLERMESDKNTRPQVWKYFASSLLLENRTGITEKKKMKPLLWSYLIG